MPSFKILLLTLTASGYLLSIFKCLENLKIIIKQRQFNNCTAKAIYTILGLINITDQYLFVVKIPFIRIKLQKCTYYESEIFV